MAVYERIADYISSHGIKQKFISDSTGIEAGKLSNILHGKRVLKADEYEKICRVLGKSPNYFVDNE